MHRHGLLPGESLNIRRVMTADGRPAEQVVIASPSGRNYAYQPGESGLLFSDTGELGVYSVNFLGETSQSVEYFTVNLLMRENHSSVRQKAFRLEGPASAQHCRLNQDGANSGRH
jgi:hypothetical protein